METFVADFFFEQPLYLYYFCLWPLHWASGSTIQIKKKKWYLCLAIHRHLKMNFTNIALFLPPRIMCFFCSLLLNLNTCHHIYFIRTRKFPWLLLLLHLIDQVLWVYLWNPSWIHLHLSLYWDHPCPGNHHLLMGTTSQQRDQFPLLLLCLQ